MTLDLAQFHDAFFDESFEALDTMEASLLKLNVGAPEPDLGAVGVRGSAGRHAAPAVERGVTALPGGQVAERRVATAAHLGPPRSVWASVPVNAGADRIVPAG